MLFGLLVKARRLIDMVIIRVMYPNLPGCVPSTETDSDGKASRDAVFFSTRSSEPQQ